VMYSVICQIGLK